MWNRSPGKAGDLVAAGAVQAGTAAEAVAASPLVVVCVLDYRAVRSILGGVGDALGGRTLVNLTGDTPQRAREMAAWAAEQGAGYLDGAILTPAVTIGGPEAAFLYSGPEALYEAHRPSLASLGGTASYLGADPGRAAAYDVALLDLFWTSMSGVVHAFALASAEGVPAEELLPYAKELGGYLPGMIDVFAQHIAGGHYPGDESSLVSAAAAMEHVVHTARDRGLDDGVLSSALASTRRAIDAGHGADAYSRVAQVLAEGRNPL